ncbi:MAG TPA: PP2C family protein-serine/threonine phosphatase [Bacteroidales bacterium]|nr:PP2C family protein-serine/threonine phosphatase [Bacteroidales bacterium]
MTSKAPTKRLKISTFKLNALLSVTQAINENRSREDLLKRYETILKEDLGIGKIVIYKFEEEWECLLHSGVNKEAVLNLEVEKDLLSIDEITFVTSSTLQVLSAFDIIIPVINNNSPLAFVLIGDIDEEGEGVSPTIKHLHFIQTLSNIILVAIENIRLFNESLRQEALKKELELASRMQNMLIPDKNVLPHNEKISITTFYHPHFDVGGDYYDFIDLEPDEIGFCIADVSGKGISAALLMSNFQANLRALFTREISLTALVERLNERVMRSANGEKFITLFIARYNYTTQVLEYINAGHNPPLLYQIKSRKLTNLSNGCVGMGMLEDVPVIKTGKIQIKETSKLLCYTDGLVELMDENGVEFGTQALEKNLCNEAYIGLNIRDIIEEQRILTGSTRIFDDISILGVEFY